MVLNTHRSELDTDLESSSSLVTTAGVNSIVCGKPDLDKPFWKSRTSTKISTRKTKMLTKKGFAHCDLEA